MPYNPGVVDQSGQLFAQGLSRGLESLSRGFEKMQEQKKRIIDGGKIADSIVKTYPEILQSMGMDEMDFAAKAPRDKALAIQGVMEGWGYKKAMMDLQRLKVDLNQKQADFDHSGTVYGLNEEALTAARARNRMTKETEGWQTRLRNMVINEPGVPDTARRMLQLGVPVETVSDVLKMGDYNFQPSDPVAIPGTKYFRQQVSPRSHVVVPGVGAGDDKYAPNEEWVYDDDPEVFRRNLLKLPRELAKEAIQQRRSFRLSTGQKEETDWEDLLRGELGGRSGGGSGGKQRFKFDSNTMKLGPGD